jgi:hypothetical protein
MSDSALRRAGFKILLFEAALLHQTSKHFLRFSIGDLLVFVLIGFYLINIESFPNDPDFWRKSMESDSAP